MRMYRIHPQQVWFLQKILAKDQLLVLLRMFKPYAFMKNMQTKRIKRRGGGREEGRKENKSCSSCCFDNGSFENNEGHRPILQKNTHKISHTISEVSWVSFIRIYDS